MKKWNALRTAVAICLLLCLALMPAALGEGINTGDFDEVYDMLDTWFEDEPAAEEEKTDVDAIYAFTLDGASYAFPCPMNALLNNGWNYAGWAADEGWLRPLLPTFSPRLTRMVRMVRIWVECG